MISDAKSCTIKVAIIRNGPKGIFEVVPAFLVKTIGKEYSVPKNEAKKSISRAFSGPPTKMPNKNPSFTSPPPIHRPFDNSKSR